MYWFSIQKDMFKTAQQIHDMEEKRRAFIKQEEIKAERKNNKASNKAEKLDCKWNSSKIREELCLIHEADQFFRLKYKRRYGEKIPKPNKVLK